MATDYLSALNKSGSGLNLASLTNDLVTAQIAPRQNIINTRIDASEASISALGRLRASFDDLSAGLALAAGADVRTASSSDSALSVRVEDATKLSARAMEVDVFQLAAPQVLEFKGLAGPTTEIGAGSLTIDFGVWTGEPPDSFAADPGRSPATVSIAAGTTLAELAAQLDAVAGVSAQVFDIGDGTYSLGVSSETGVAKSLRLTALPGGAVPVDGIDLAVFDTTATNSTVQVQAGSDMMLFLDGIAMFRDTNELRDVIPGVTLGINATTARPATVSTANDTEGMADLFAALTDRINATLSVLSEVTARGIDGTAAGDLAGDAGARAAQRALTSMLGRGFGGFGEGTAFLSDVGVTTNRDGSLRFDRDAFAKSFAADPAKAANLLRDAVTSGTEGVEITGTPWQATTAAGQYDFAHDAGTMKANMGGVQVNGTMGEDGRITYTATSGVLAGVSITVDPDVTSARLDFGRSFVSEVTETLRQINGAGGTISRREDQLAATINADTDALSALDDTAETLESRYIAQFTAMEQIVSQLNSTGEYLTNLIAAWNKD
ncbi:flagellar filament capping protein FliD [Meridianimarinicoccus sp. RP-17]|uniref:flagellar filament capping protein FliD n=1 Tax=Meridianimarinicoccus zhengii TaxID=2056810 RepID=UPI000DACFCC2|nr:flagellar filament capping protein FliD [Phycocomes zhengii]